MRRFWPALAAGALLGGIALRVWVLSSSLGALESDEAITGLMARRALHGDLTLVYWLSNYGGTQESLLTAGVFAVTGSSTLVLKLVPLALFAVATALVWRVGRRTVGEPAARAAALLYWIWPAYLVWWTVKARAYYAFGTVCGLAVLLLALRLRERDSRLDAAGLGLALGLGWWATPEVLIYALPAVAWLAWRRPAALRLAWIAAPAAVLGALPWLAWNARNGWLSLHLGAVAGEGSTYGGRLVDLFRIVLPTWLGLRVPFSLHWLLGPVVGSALLALALAGFVLLVLRRSSGLEPLLLVAGAFPFLYAASSFAYYVDEPRYLVLFGPGPALLLGRMLARPPVAAAGLVAALALSVVGLARMQRDGLYEPRAPDVRVPADISPLLTTLERERIDRVLANYWLAYRISFESRERILATSTGFVRDQVADRIVRSSPSPARVFLAGSVAERRARAGLRGYRRIASGSFVVYAPRAS